MIQFTTLQDKQANVITRVDLDGDLAIEINGVAVLYIDKEDGIIARMYFDEREAERLRSVGFKTKTHVDGVSYQLKVAGELDDKE